MMNDETFNILRAAVTLAKNEQICTVSALRSRLLQLFPDKEAQTEEAILCWAQYTQ